jgi:hypothetical protein
VEATDEEAAEAARDAQVPFGFVFRRHTNAAGQTEIDIARTRRTANYDDQDIVEVRSVVVFCLCICARTVIRNNNATGQSASEWRR